MRATILDEPLLEFGEGARHVDPRYGLVHYGPADLNVAGRPKEIRVGIVGTPQSISETEQWLTSLRDPLPSRDPSRPGLWPEFPGFNKASGFRAEIALDPRMQRPIRQRDFDKISTIDPRRRRDAAVDLFVEEIQSLTDETNPHVIFCVLPDEIDDWEPAEAEADQGVPDTLSKETVDSGRMPAFHDLLKARAMPSRIPLQLLRGTTYDPSRARAQKRRKWKLSEREDAATIAWNLLTAVYYKAGGSPWRMIRHSTDLDTCFVGVSFYKTAEGKTATSVAQVYNQLGEGVVVRGGPAYRSDEDKQLHLAESDAREIVMDAMRIYKREHRHPPARIIVHKTTAFDAAEQAGMLDARDALDLDLCELVWISNPQVRLHRDAYHPPLRGTFLTLGDKEGVLYTRGSVEWFETYAAMYVPRPISLRPALIERSLTDIAAEVLALSKMNWNSTRFDGRVPVSIRTARRVADIIRHMPLDATVETKYGYYM